MILSRLVLNPFHARTYQIVGDPYLIHQKLCACVGTNRKESGILYRIEEGPILLVQSLVQPDWSKFGESAEIFKAPPQSKKFEIDLREDQRLSFRLRCRPSKKVKNPDGKNSQFRFLRTEEEQFEWLRRQSERAGFRVESVELTVERWLDTKPNPAAVPDPSSLRVESLRAIRFDGVAVVTDPSKLSSAVSAGIGPQKAYGFGMLSLGRAEQ